jgi:hypothetical protein
MDNPLRVGKDNAYEGEKKNFFNTFALEIGLSELKSHYRIADCIELIVKCNLILHFVTVWNMALEVRSVAE